MVGGLRLRNTETAAAFDLKGRLLGFSLGFFFVNIFFAGWAWSVVRKNKHRWASYTYSAMLYIAAGLFIFIAIRFPQIKGMMIMMSKIKHVSKLLLIFNRGD